ncbi:MAG: methyl-accepting chemotaxis protein [Pseudomonadota bacterium]
MAVAIVALTSVVVILESSLLERMGSSVTGSLAENGKSADNAMNQLSTAIAGSLVRMTETARTQITEESERTLNEEKRSVAESYSQVLTENMETIAELLVRVAPKAIVTNDFMELITYARSASQHPDIVYAIYLKPDGKPLSRFVDKDHPKIQTYLQSDSDGGKIEKILSASAKDETVFRIEKPVALEGKPLGSLVLCVSRDRMSARLQGMDLRFGEMITGNAALIAGVMASERDALNRDISDRVGKIRREGQETRNSVVAEIDDSISTLSHRTRQSLIITGAAVTAFVILTAFILISRISKAIQRMAGDLRTGAEQVASAAGQVSSYSQSLAEGSSEQAASIEETSSSLEEMSSMTKQNADNATQADLLMKEANSVVLTANRSMNALTASMSEISTASEETSKIIKTIDEIAFQTNLLALNAAVEAARAGEAGAGFAVVADEVRNLAMRAAEAAKNTANLIEGTVKKVKDGSELVVSTNAVFASVSEAETKVGELVSEIAAASSEQARGIDQINIAVTEMDKVTQSNTAGAEESASAAEEMSVQAEQMKVLVKDLVKIVAGAAAESLMDNKSNGSFFRRKQRTVTDANIDGPPRKLQAKKIAQEIDTEELFPRGDDPFSDC